MSLGKTKCVSADCLAKFLPTLIGYVKLFIALKVRLRGKLRKSPELAQSKLSSNAVKLCGIDLNCSSQKMWNVTNCWTSDRCWWQFLRKAITLKVRLKSSPGAYRATLIGASHLNWVFLKTLINLFNFLPLQQWHQIHQKREIRVCCVSNRFMALFGIAAPHEVLQQPKLSSPDLLVDVVLTLAIFWASVNSLVY